MMAKRVVCILLLSLQAVTGFCSDATPVRDLDISASDLTRISMSDLVKVLRDKAKLRINFVERSYEEKEIQTRRERIEEIKLIPPENRTPSEISMLNNSSLPGVNLDVGILFKCKRQTISPVDLLGLKSALDYEWVKKIEAGFSDYLFILSNGSYIIQPKVSGEGMDGVTISLKDASLIEALKALEEHVLKKMNISIVGDPVFFEMFKDKKINIDVKDAPLGICLSRFCESLGPDIIWTIRGQKGYRKLQFNLIYPEPPGNH